MLQQSLCGLPCHPQDPAHEHECSTMQDNSHPDLLHRPLVQSVLTQHARMHVQASDIVARDAGQGHPCLAKLQSEA
eukprot:749835-Pelagomonas_calceolata.AAC.8